jgi:ribosomal protein S18 acetylase RimI-like enzyme
MKVREIYESDVSALAEMIINYKLEQDPNFHDSARSDIVNILLALVNQNKITTLVALKKKEKIIGFINYHEILFPMIAGREIYISDLIVDKNERGKGIGKTLIAEVDKIANNMKITRLMLNNSIESECYISGFYKNLGFEERKNYSNFVKIY